MPGTPGDVVYLATYYGRALPYLYKKDSARISRDGVVEFSSTDSSFMGGIYVILLSDKQTYFEFLLQKGDDIGISADPKNIPVSVAFTNAPENDRFRQYMLFLKDYAATQEGFKKDYAAAKTHTDSLAVRKKQATSTRELTDYRKHYVTQYPGTLLADIFNALEKPEIPGGSHYLADGKTKDSTFSYTYYKQHFWDDFNFSNNELIHAPILDGRLEEYMRKLVLAFPDSVEHESDMLLAKTRESKDLFKYTLWWLTRFTEESKVMGMDEAFVYLIENYYMKGDAYWLSNEELSQYIERAMKIAPNVIGNVAPAIKLNNVATGKGEDLLSGKAPYTIVVFYSPECSHCQKEIPALDSLYNAVLKKKGVQVFTVSTEGDSKKINDFMQKNGSADWTNTWDPDHTGDWRNNYDVYSTPTIYLLDDKKIIRGKRLDHSSIMNVIDMLEKRARAAKSSKS